MKSLLLNPVKTGLVFLATIIAISSCTNESQGLEGLDPVCFESQILPLIQSSCAVSGCHDAGTSEDGYNFTSYNNIIKVVNPGDARGSKLYTVLSEPYGAMMPPHQPLSMDNRNLIKIWIEQGAKNTSCTNTAENPEEKKDSVCFSHDILPLLSSSCAKSGCHDAITAEEGFSMTSYANIAQNPKLIKPGFYSDSKLYKVITISGEDRMPPAPATALTSEQISKIKKWISDGALNSICTSASCDTSGAISFNTKVWPIIQYNCLGCHPASGTTNGISLGNYNQIKTVAANMRNSKPLLSGVIHQLNGFIAMPQNGRLDDCKIATIDKWISEGMVNN